MEKVFNVKGMMCPHCEARVKQSVESLPQVASAVADHKTGTVTVTLTEAIADVRGGEVTRAVRDSSASDGTPIHDGDVMGIQDGSIDVVGSDVADVTIELINKMQEDEEGDSLTILAGSDMDDESFEALIARIEEAQPDLEIDSHRGEQPLYPVIFSIE